MAGHQAMTGGGRLAVGIGCRTGARPEAVVDLVRRCLSAAGATEAAGAGVALFTVQDKVQEPGLGEAAVRLGLPLVFLPRALLEAASAGAETRSERVVALFGVPSVAETAALAGAGPGARLVVPRIAGDGVTCAVARLPAAGAPDRAGEAP
ncbi:cobalamin biosynthesis protein [Prosthecomicrobium sp. N25]|uniref:cobalamin biosynthesis protein n=1 Tax=Prosthecomicrobium sp. N25 TaxID=3129254 RepID=UPI003077E43F